MKKEKTTLSLIIENLVYLVFFVLFIIGIVHTYKHHNKIAFITSFFPPVGIYRGAESFWHKDKDKFADIDWNKRMKGDVHILYVLLASDPKQEQMSEFNETLEKFSKRISDYPVDKKNYLKDAAKKYGRFMQALNTDFNLYFKEYFDKQETNATLDWSKKSKPILDSIINDYDLKELSSSYSEMDSSIQIISKHKTEVNEENIDPELFFKGMKKLITSDMYRINRTYKMIFNEDIGISINEDSDNIKI